MWMDFVWGLVTIKNAISGWVEKAPLFRHCEKGSLIKNK